MTRRFHVASTGPQTHDVLDTHYLVGVGSTATYVVVASYVDQLIAIRRAEAMNRGGFSAKYEYHAERYANALGRL